MFNPFSWRSFTHRHDWRVFDVHLAYGNVGVEVQVVSMCKECGARDSDYFLKNLPAGSTYAYDKTIKHRTHCRRGLHRMTRDNTIVNADGSHRCRACRNAWKASASQ